MRASAILSFLRSRALSSPASSFLRFGAIVLEEKARTNARNCTLMFSGTRDPANAEPYTAPFSLTTMASTMRCLSLSRTLVQRARTTTTTTPTRHLSTSPLLRNDAPSAPNLGTVSTPKKPVGGFRGGFGFRIPPRVDLVCANQSRLSCVCSLGRCACGVASSVSCLGSRSRRHMRRITSSTNTRPPRPPCRPALKSFKLVLPR